MIILHVISNVLLNFPCAFEYSDTCLRKFDFKIMTCVTCRSFIPFHNNFLADFIIKYFPSNNLYLYPCILAVYFCFYFLDRFLFTSPGRQSINIFVPSPWQQFAQKFDTDKIQIVWGLWRSWTIETPHWSVVRTIFYVEKLRNNMSSFRRLSTRVVSWK